MDKRERSDHQRIERGGRTLHNRQTHQPRGLNQCDQTRHNDTIAIPTRAP